MEVLLAAIALTVALVLYWAIIGLAVVSLLYSRRNLVQGLLLAPIVGVSATVVPTFWLSNAGLPVSRFAAVLFAFMLAVSVIQLVWSARRGRWRRYAPAIRAILPFVGIAAVALVLTGWPALEFGLQWLSFANDDMANYVLDSHRLADRGLLTIPDVDVVAQGLDYTQIYWFYAVAGIRPGSQLILASVISLTDLSGYEIFMPTVLALNVVLIWTAGALVCQSPRLRSAALLTCFLLSLSAMSTIGLLHQLIAQVVGLAILAGAALLALRLLGPPMPAAVAVRHGLLTGIIGSALMIVYPEAAPFLGASFALLALVYVSRRRFALPWRTGLVILGTSLATCVVFVNSYLILSLTFLFSQARHAFERNALDVTELVFPYFLIPSGLANLWGFQYITFVPPEPWSSLTIAVGGMLLLYTLLASIVLAWRGYYVSYVSLAMFAVLLQLFFTRNDFGLYKIVMYMQPFILGVIAISWLLFFHHRWYWIASFVLLGLAGLPVQQAYVESSRGGQAFTSIPDASASSLNEELIQVLAPTSREHGSHLVVDTPNIVLSKIAAAYTRGIHTNFPSQRLFVRFSPSLLQPTLGEDINHSALVISNALESHELKGSFPWFTGVGVSADEPFPIGVEPTEFTLNTVGIEPTESDLCDYLVGSTARQNLLNRRRYPADGPRTLFLRPCDDVRDYLIFVDASIARHYYTFLVRSDLIGLNQLEPDPLRAGATFAGLGRRLLLHVMHPSEQPRLLIDVSTTLKGDGENRLPPAAAIGTQRVPMGVVGRGSARVFSDPVVPVTIADRALIGLDMGIRGQRFNVARSGLMAAYGTDVYLDRRLLTVFARDVSLVSAEEYAAIKPPSRIDDLVSGLANRDLEYSGVYEDGWVSEASFFRLAQQDARSTVFVKGVVPRIDDASFTTELRLLVDGQEIAQSQLKPGPFEIRGPVPIGQGLRRVELQFSAFQRLRDPDNRPVAADLKAIGIEAASAIAPPTSVNKSPGSVDDPSLAASGLYADGWLAERSYVTLTQPAAPAELVVQGQVPQIDNPAFTAELTILVDGQDAARKTIGVGDFELRAPAPSQSGERRVELRFSATQQLPAPDGRQVGALMKSIGFESSVPAAQPAAATPSLAPPPAGPTPPQAVTDPHTDLGNPALQAAGLDGDGWVAGTSAFTLTQPVTASQLVVRGMVPLVDDPAHTTELRVLVDGQDVTRQTLGLGDFVVTAPIPASATAQRRVELRFSATQRLPAPDTRQVGARVQFLGFAGN